MKKLSSNKGKLPIVFSKEYNVTFTGLQCSYPYDTQKGQNVLNHLKRHNFVHEELLHEPEEMREIDLLVVHSAKYLDSLKYSEIVARIAEIPLLSFIPNVFVQKGYLRAMRFQASGTLLAAKLAVREGWSINLGGGFCHCSAERGGSFSPYADISLAVKHLILNERSISKVMILDLSARQGEGHERDYINIKSVYIMDMFNEAIYPRDNYAEVAVRKPVKLPPCTSDEVYLRKLRINLAEALNEFHPDIIVYVAGTDVLEGDVSGRLNVTPEGVISRDAYVFSKAVSQHIPIVMLLGLGFVRASAQTIANSIINLKEKGLLCSKNWLR